MSTVSRVQHPKKFNLESNLQGLEELLDIFYVSLDVEGDHPTESLGLPLHQLVLGVGGETRKDDLADVRRALYVLGHCHGIGLVFLHPDVQCL